MVGVFPGPCLEDFPLVLPGVLPGFWGDDLVLKARFFRFSRGSRVQFPIRIADENSGLVCNAVLVFRFAGVAQLVEHHVANVIVDGSSPFTRSHFSSGSLLEPLGADGNLAACESGPS